MRHNGRKPKINKKVSQEGTLSKCVPAGKRYQAKKQSATEQEVQATPAEAYDQPLHNHCGFNGACHSKTSEERTTRHEKAGKQIEIFDIDDLLESTVSQHSEEEDPNIKFKSAIVFGALPKLDFEEESDNGSTYAKGTKQISRNSSSVNLSKAYHNDGQSTHVSSRESCAPVDHIDQHSEKPHRMDLKGQEQAVEKDTASIRSPSLGSNLSVNSVDTSIKKRQNYNLIQNGAPAKKAGQKLPVKNGFVGLKQLFESIGTQLSTQKLAFTPSTPYVHKFRTEMCRNFELYGRCKYGDEVSGLI